MAVIEITEFERCGYIIFKNKFNEWEIKELGIAFKTSQEAETYLKNIINNNDFSTELVTN